MAFKYSIICVLLSSLLYSCQSVSSLNQPSLISKDNEPIMDCYYSGFKKAALTNYEDYPEYKDFINRNTFFDANVEKNTGLKEGFFTLADDSGNIIYTQKDRFNFNQDGTFLSKDGYLVLGVFDKNRDVINRNNFSDLNKNANGIIVDFTKSSLEGLRAEANVINETRFKFSELFDNKITSIISYIDEKGIKDRIFSRFYVPSGQLKTIHQNGLLTIEEISNGITIGTIGEQTVELKISPELNIISRTSLDNAKVIAEAVNRLADKTGIAASVVMNLNDRSQGTLVFGPVNRIISLSLARMPTAPAFEDIVDTLKVNKIGLLKTFKDKQDNFMYEINALSLVGNKPDYKPDTHALYNFSFSNFAYDFTYDNNGVSVSQGFYPSGYRGVLLNDFISNNNPGEKRKVYEDSHGIIYNEAPLNTGLRIALTIFSNDSWKKKSDCGKFRYTEALDKITIGYHGLPKISVISKNTGIEEGGQSDFTAFIGPFLDALHDGIFY